MAEFPDDVPLAADHRQALVELAWRLRQFDAVSLAAWTHRDVAAASVLADQANIAADSFACRAGCTR